MLSENDGALLTQAGALGTHVARLAARGCIARSRSSPRTSKALAALRELQAELSRYVDSVELDPARLHEIEERLNLLQSLKRKYGTHARGSHRVRRRGAAEACNHWNSAMCELARLNAELQKLDRELLRRGQQLSAERKKLIPKLSKAVAKELGALGFQQSKFDVALSRSEIRISTSTSASSGLDTVEFQFAPNPGEPSRPLRAIASSGEMARVMLALKTVLAAEDDVPVLIFDEVDANVGGETANAVGRKDEADRARRIRCCASRISRRWPRTPTRISS